LAEKRRRSDREEAQKIRILAIDDDVAYLRYVQLVLGNAGFDVVVASSGAAAIERVRADRSIGLILVDLSMPGMDGIQTVQKLHHDFGTKGLYTILLTAHDGTETKLLALDSGLDDFVTKTTPASEIIAKIRSAARRLAIERSLSVENQELEMLAFTDELTKVANRRALSRAGEDLLAAGHSVSVLLLDLDDFKQVNDTLGHPAGDRVLADVAQAIKDTTRVQDVIGRLGGDEFVVLLPDTGHAEASAIAERIAAAVRALRWPRLPTPLTISYGCVTSREGGDFATLLSDCDRLLYAAKGRRERDKGRLETQPSC
jgi:diguanylate cyclase (GGDEF)-like protein